MKTISLVFLLAAFPAYAQSDISGTAHIVDGDTIHVISASGLTKVRLQGIAAPEKRQPGGAEAGAFLERFAEGKSVRCELDGTKTHKREVGVCYVGGQDIAAAVIKAGLARDCPRFSGGRYRAIERPESLTLFLPEYCKTP